MKCPKGCTSRMFLVDLGRSCCGACGALVNSDGELIEGIEAVEYDDGCELAPMNTNVDDEYSQALEETIVALEKEIAYGEKHAYKNSTMHMLKGCLQGMDKSLKIYKRFVLERR